MIGKSSCLSTFFIGSYHHFYIAVVIDYNHGDLPIINLPMKP